MKPPIFKPRKPSLLDNPKVRFFLADDRWVGRYKGKQAVGATKEECAEKLAELIDKPVS